jgi:hypothetical protein
VAVHIAGPQTQAPLDAIPRCQHLRTRDLADRIAGPRQHDTAFDGDADLVTLLGGESERFMRVVVGGNARAAEAGSWIDTSQPILRRNSPAKSPPIDPPMTTARFRWPAAECVTTGFCWMARAIPMNSARTQAKV